MMDSVDDIAGAAADHAIDPPPAIGRDERRMHVRAYNAWVGMLHGRELPSVDALDPARVGDFAPHGVLLDLAGDPGDPAIAWLGDALRAEAGMTAPARTIAQVPPASLLARLAGHAQQVLAKRAPIGFEAEFVNVRGNTALYRGILMPFSSDHDAIDHVYGVVNWTEVVEPQTAAEILAAARAAMAAVPAPPQAPIAPVWADGPSRAAPATPPAGTLPEMLPLLREAGTRCHAAELRARDALHEALGAAYDLAFAAETDADGYAALLARADIRTRPRAPWQAVVKLVFAERLSRGCVAEYAAVLAHAWRHDVAPGELRRFLETQPHGLRGIVAAERACRRAEAG